ncbi:MAG: hypothetical protein U0W65_17455 [Bacteroidia bacterium]
MKYKISFNLTFGLFVVLFSSCKKESNIPITSFLPSKQSTIGESILTSSKWKQTHTYYDTSNYAKLYLNLWPLSSTFDIPMDSCSLTSKIWYHSNHNLYTIKGLPCPSSDPDTNLVASWNLILNDSKIVFGGVDTMEVLEINNNNIKLWYKSYVLDSIGSVLYTEYNMWKFEPSL